jgi:hypothetical protein
VGDIEGLGLNSVAESSQVASGKANAATLKAGEKLVEAMDVADQERKRYNSACCFFHP